MAWTEEVGNGNYYACFRGADGKQDKVRDKRGNPIQFSSNAVAKREAFDAEDEARDPDRLPKDAGKQTWGDWCDEWWPDRTIEANTHHNEESLARNHIRSTFGHLPLEEIDRDAIQKWVNKLPLAPSTTHVAYAVLSASLTAAVVARKIRATPCVKIKLPVIPPPKIRDLTHEEFDATVVHLVGIGRMLALLLVGTGMRWQEGAGLHIDDVDLRRRTAHIWQVYSRRGKHLKPCPKSQKPRTVPLPDWLAAELQTWMRDLEPASRCGTEHKLKGSCRSGLVLPWTGGACLSAEYSRRTLGRAVKLARVPDEDGELVPIRHATLHDLRDTYASWLLQDGVPIEHISELLGHASIEMTKKRYAQFGDRRFDAVRDVLNAAKPAPVVPQRPTGNIIQVDFRRRSGA